MVGFVTSPPPFVIQRIVIYFIILPYVTVLCGKQGLNPSILCSNSCNIVGLLKSNMLSILENTCLCNTSKILNLWDREQVHSWMPEEKDIPGDKLPPNNFFCGGVPFKANLEGFEGVVMNSTPSDIGLNCEFCLKGGVWEGLPESLVFSRAESSKGLEGSREFRPKPRFDPCKGKTLMKDMPYLMCNSKEIYLHTYLSLNLKNF